MLEFEPKEIPPNTSFVAFINDEETDFKEYRTLREQMYKFLHKPKFQIFVVGLVILDCIIVFTELILEHYQTYHIYVEILHYSSITILSIFVVEICLKLFAFGLDFFFHKLEVFDAVIVILSLILDIVLGSNDVFGLLIVLRLWRIVRILNGVVSAVMKRNEKKLEDEKRLRQEVNCELGRSQQYCSSLEMQIEALQQLLIVNGITDLPKTNVPNKINEFTTVAEINHS